MLRISMAALTALALSAGVPDCTPAKLQHPPVAAEAAKAEPKLEGVWAGQANGVEFTLTFGGREGARLDAVLTGREPGKGVGVLAYEAIPAALGGKTYLSLQEKKYSSMLDDKYELLPGYTLVRYELKGDSLSIWYLLQGAAQKGGLHPADQGEEPRPFTDEGPALAAYLAKADAAAWSSFGTFKRQKLDVPRAPGKKK